MLLHMIVAAARQAWPPFVLVAGLLLIGGVGAADGLFEAAAAKLARLRLGPRGLLVGMLVLVAVVTAVFNLDTSVVFLTPVLVHAARRRGFDERPFLYGSVFMANSASLLLPGSNLTNLLVFSGRPQSGLAFAVGMLPAWIAACAVTGAFVVLAFPPKRGEPAGDAPPSLRAGVGAVAALVAAAAVLLLPNPALPVLALGVGATTVRRIVPRLDVKSLGVLFAVAVGLGTVGRSWHGPENLVNSGGSWTSAAVGAAGSVLINNLPAAVLLSTQPPAHPHALLLGLDLGPNLAVTGSLSALLWLQSARVVGARASVGAYSRFGLVLAPLSLVVTLAALHASRL